MELVCTVAYTDTGAWLHASTLHVAWLLMRCCFAETLNMSWCLSNFNAVFMACLLKFVTAVAQEFLTGLTLNRASLA